MSQGRRGYSLMYRFGVRPWEIDPISPELVAWAEAYPGPPNRAIDLGCGSGRHAVYLAQHGWKVVGVDFAAPAVEQARRRAHDAGVDADFVVGDVTRLGGIELGPAFQLVLDMKCFHGVPASLHTAYAAGVAGICQPGGTYLLFALAPNRVRRFLGAPRGVSSGEVRALFGHEFDCLEISEGSGGLFTPSFYRMRRYV